jgi:hypothetical protein
MAKKEILYTCEVCGKKYHREDVANLCEKGHFKIAEITKTEYDPKDVKGIFPASIMVRLKDGYGNEKMVQYMRKGGDL